MGDSSVMTEPLTFEEEDVFVASLEDPAKKYASITKVTPSGIKTAVMEPIPDEENERKEPSFWGSKLMWFSLIWAAIVIIIVAVAASLTAGDDDDDKKAPVTPVPTAIPMEPTPAVVTMAPTSMATGEVTDVPETEAPGVTDAPVATEAPVATTGAPTESPAAVTEAPVAVTEAPTAPPVATEAPTAAPVATDPPTAAPVATDPPTAAPIPATDAPVAATDSPTPAATEAATTAAPVATTVAPTGLELTDLLPDWSLSQLEDPLTPQSRASLFVQYDPAYTERTALELLQRYALATLYFGLTGTGWNAGAISPVTGECDWFAEAGTTCTDAGVVNVLGLVSNNVVGEPIPNEISLLSDLTSIDLSGNEIGGNIPTYLGDLAGLESLNLSSNPLTGAVPTELAAIPTLASIDLTGTALAGPLPSELCDITTFDCQPVGGLCGCDGCECV